MELNEQLRFVIGRIRSTRLEKHISQLQLAALANMSSSFLASIEGGKKQPSVLTILKIANALDVSPKDFFPESHTKDKNQIKREIQNLLDNL